MRGRVVVCKIPCRGDLGEEWSKHLSLPLPGQIIVGEREGICIELMTLDRDHKASDRTL